MSERIDRSPMNGKELIRLALDLGFSDAAVIDTENLVFVPNFRTLCEENTASTMPARLTAGLWKKCVKRSCTEDRHW